MTCIPASPIPTANIPAMMTILHVYSPDDGLAAAYIDMLTQATGDKALMLRASTASGIADIMQEKKPDILHLHGNPKLKLPKLCRLVITPHGEQPDMLQAAYTIVARSDMEAQVLKERHARVETVRNPLITRTITPEECSLQMLTIYRRVMDSNVLQLMNANTSQAIDAMMLLAITGNRQWLPKSKLNAYELSDSDKRKIIIFSKLEGIIDYIGSGARLMGVELHELANTSSYLPVDYKIPAPIGKDTVTDILADIQDNGISFLRLIEAAKALRSDLLDEEQLLAMTRKLQLTTMLEAVVQLLAEHSLITEGFMPCLPSDNSLARQMRYQLQNRQSPFYIK